MKESIELKPEPLDCYGRISMTTAPPNTSLLNTSNSNDLNSVEFSQLTPINHSFGPGLVVSQTTLSTSNSCITPTTTTTTTSVISCASNMVLSPLPSSDSLIMVTNTPTSIDAQSMNANVNTTTVGAGSVSATSTPTSSSKSHSGNGPYRCRECNKEFRILRYLEKHRRIHTGEKPYQCCYCGRQFNDWPNMNRHKRIHTGKFLVCSNQIITKSKLTIWFYF